jgi:hypothetical protein
MRAFVHQKPTGEEILANKIRINQCWLIIARTFPHLPTENPSGIHRLAVDRKEFDRALISHSPAFLVASAAHPDYSPTNSPDR